MKFLALLFSTCAKIDAYGRDDVEAQRTQRLKQMLNDRTQCAWFSTLDKEDKKIYFDLFSKIIGRGLYIWDYYIHFKDELSSVQVNISREIEEMVSAHNEIMKDGKLTEDDFDIIFSACCQYDFVKTFEDLINAPFIDYVPSTLPKKARDLLEQFRYLPMDCIKETRENLPGKDKVIAVNTETRISPDLCRQQLNDNRFRCIF